MPKVVHYLIKLWCFTLCTFVIVLTVYSAAGMPLVAVGQLVTACVVYYVLIDLVNWGRKHRNGL